MIHAPDSHPLPHASSFDPWRELPVRPPEEHNELAVEVERRVRQVEAHVRARPIATVAIAALAGFILGRILRD